MESSLLVLKDTLGKSIPRLFMALPLNGYCQESARLSADGKRIMALFLSAIRLVKVNACAVARTDLAALCRLRTLFHQSVLEQTERR